MNLFELVAKLSLDSSEYDKGVSNAEKSAKSLGDNLTKAGKAMAGVSAAGAVVATSIGTLAYKAGTSADDLNTLSKVTGIGTYELQKYGAAADLVDVSVETVARANKKLAKNAYEASKGSKSQAKAFNAIGVSVVDANGNLRDSEDIFQDVIANLGKMTNETERNAIAQKLMGKSAAELNPLIEDGGKTYKMVSDTLKKYDLDYVDQETLDKANQFNDSLDTMKLIGKVAIANVGSQLAGYLAPALEKVVDLVGRFANWLSKLDPRLLTIIATIGGVLAVVAPLLITLGKVATGVSAIIKVVNLASGAIGALSAGTLLPIIAVIGAVIAIGVLLYKNWDKIKAAAKALGDKIRSVWTSIKTATVNTWNTIRDAITKPFTSAYDKVKNIIKTIKGWFPIKLGKIFKGIKLPHFDVEWSYVKAFGRKINFPSGFDISWYRKAQDQPYLFTNPTLFGAGEGTKDEMLYGRQALLNDIREAVGSTGSSTVEINVYATPQQDERQIAEMVQRQFVLWDKQRRAAYV